MDKHVKFLPWVGHSYSEADVRILFVGMKLYSDDPMSVSDNATTECVNYYLNEDEYEHYFDSFDKIINVVKHPDHSRAEAWSRVAFYNYTQEVLPTSKSRPTKEQIDRSWDAFVHLLLHLRPHKIIFWGKWLYNQMFIGYGVEAQYINGHQTWMVDAHELDASIPSAQHVFHITYVEDPSSRTFAIAANRQIMDIFLASAPEPYKNPHNKRRISQIIRALQLDFEGFRMGDLDFVDVLAKAMAVGLLHLVPEAGVIDNQRLSAGSNFASSYFAYCLREKCRARLTDNGLDAQQKLAELLNDERFDMTLSDDGSEIRFRGKKSKNRVKQLFAQLSAIRHGTDRQIEWKALEALFDIPNLRQNTRHIGHNKDYARAIDDFFGLTD